MPLVKVIRFYFFNQTFCFMIRLQLQDKFQPLVRLDAVLDHADRWTDPLHAEVRYLLLRAQSVKQHESWHAELVRQFLRQGVGFELLTDILRQLDEGERLGAMRTHLNAVNVNHRNAVKSPVPFGVSLLL